MKVYLVKVAAGLALITVLAYMIGAYSPYAEMRDLPSYTVSTVTRITMTLVLSVLWGVSFGILAATNKTAGYVVTPVIDLLQSIPILGYFPLVIGFLFTWGAFGVEVSVIVLLFTSMAWAIFFGVVAAVRAIPANVIEASRSFGITGWKYTRHIILPAIAPALVAGANLAWSDGWFFMIAAEYIEYKGAIVSPPSGGIGVLLARSAYFYRDMGMAVQLLVYVTVLVVVINSLSWHRLMNRAGAGTFKPIFQIGLSGVGKMGYLGGTGWFSLEHIQVPKAFSAFWQRLEDYTRRQKMLTAVIAAVIIAVFLIRELDHLPSASTVAQAFTQPPGEEFGGIHWLILMTMGRLTVAYIISLAVALGLGVLAAEHKLAAAIINPVYDIGQGVPILALFPAIYLGLSSIFGSQRLALEVTCVVMLVLDMIWYMFVNVSSAVKNIPAEIREVGSLFGFKGMKRITHIIIPSILPAIVTGSILSWGTGWNTVIFSEYLPSTGPGVPDVYVPGLGSLLDKAGYVYGNTIILVVIVMIIAAIVLSMEALIWRPLLRRFEKYKVEV
ncbi:MAG: ABC transporter permease subunit [Candidatus Bathyarchaeota archaeon]